MNTERDMFLTEAMGWPWHEVVSIDDFKVTCSCGMSGYMNPCYNLNFSTWEGFGKLWTWAQKQEWWDLFFWKQPSYDAYIIHPDHLANAVYEFLKEKK